MNTVPFSDFYRKCFQLQFSELKSIDYSSDASVSNLPIQNPNKNKRLSFESIVQLLHKSFGGNYRALEFFDELYQQKGDHIIETLEQLAQIGGEATPQDIKDGVLNRMSENLIFQELLSYLDATDLDTLLVLAQFNIPVLPIAIGMQRNQEDRTTSLQKAVQLTLIEWQQSTDQRERYYVIPLVKDLLKEREFCHPIRCQISGRLPRIYL